jgi:hypothetical protein
LGAPIVRPYRERISILIHVNITAGDLDYLRELAGLGDERCACS